MRIYEAEQFDLFNGMVDRTDAYSRNSDPETSEEAAESIRTTDAEAVVLEALKEFGADGATSHDLVAQTGMWPAPMMISSCSFSESNPLAQGFIEYRVLLP